MKGRVTEPVSRTEGLEVGGGIDCPNCGEDMRKTFHTDIKLDLTGVDSAETTSGPANTVYICDECGYHEEVERFDDRP